ncbi:putative Actin cross-linking protein [Tripterygium wilfordii]|uniref:Putative Actin cross-linking protein n=1 Tax=Tripterygium wilfordii TaxID=458696 RepID=A0A7J7BY38_TRIWF|nr:putative Actin cross-linking protein [Tripterygium wilfordii]
MEFFRKAKAVRLRGHHDKYLYADEDEESVTQDRNGSSKNARWAVEFAPGSESILRLKSCYGKYLTASNQPFLLGMTGRKVIQSLPRRLDSSLEWEPIREGSQIKLKTRYGNFLRANGGLPPWRNSVTHDIPHRTSTQDWILWDVDVVEILVQSPGHHPPAVPPVAHSDSLDFESSSPSSVPIKSGNFSRQESSDSYSGGSPPKSEGRTIYYHVADENGEVDDDVVEGYSFIFKGNGVDELTKKLMEEMGLEDIIVCSRSPLNGKLYPLRLQLPPNNADMHVIIVQSSAKGIAF